MNLKKTLSFIIVIFFLILFGFFLSQQDVFLKKIDKNSMKSIKINDVVIKVEVASDLNQQQKGLSFRDGLGKNEGMLFVFKKPSKYSFWMKDMNFPIDIAWIGEDMKIIYIEKNIKPETYPQAFSSDEDALYVLEVNALFFEKNNLKEGNFVEFLSP